MQTLFIKTQGCQMNEYDSAKMAEVLKASHGLRLVDTPEFADVILLNTCSIREKAQEKVFSELGRLRPYKEKRPEVIIGVGGCVASQEGRTIYQRAPYVDLVFGPQTLHRLPALLEESKQKRRFAMDISFPEIEKFDFLPKPEAKGPLAYVTVIEGCNKFCSYCVVPYTRGQELSRPMDDVIAEAYSLIQQGAKEITLLGQNVNAYRGRMHNDATNESTADLALLLRYLAEIPELQRLRFTTSHPVEFTDNLIEAYRDLPVLANHLHLPVQSGSNKILNRMKRGHTVEEYIEKIKRLQAVRQGISITSDFIIGFPGETEEDFEATLDLVHTLQLDQSYCFIYSPRPGTPAASLPDTLSLEAKKTRLNILQSRLNIQALQISKGMIGTEQNIIVTGPSKKNAARLSGRTDNNRIVNFTGPSETIGKMVSVKIIDCTTNSLVGELI